MFGQIPPTVQPAGFSCHWIISRTNKRGRTEYLTQTRMVNYETGVEIRPRLYDEDPCKALKFYNQSSCAQDSIDGDDIHKRTVCHG